MIAHCFRPAVLLAALVYSSVVPSFSQVRLQAPATAEADSKAINDWLKSINDAAKKRSYVGTFVVSSGDSMSSAKIWHITDGIEQGERVEALSGSARSVFRHNGKVVTLMPERRLARVEKRETLGLFQDLFKLADANVGEYYTIKKDRTGRVAGVEADITSLQPKDKLRFGYRVWTDKKSGLIVKLQTLDLDGKVVEQAAFSELQFEAPVKLDELAQMMSKVEGYQIEKKVELLKTTSKDEGWTWKNKPLGFKPINCFKRMNAQNKEQFTVQWVFTDGVASVSVFAEPYDAQRHDKESSLSLGATQTVTKRIDRFWVTVMGEVPTQTLRLFAAALERLPSTNSQ